MAQRKGWAQETALLARALQRERRFVADHQPGKYLQEPICWARPISPAMPGGPDPL